MRSVRVLVGALVALAVVCGGSTAMAAKYVFDIDVTERFGGGDFTPFSFQQTWTFKPAPFTGSVNGDPPGFTQRSITPTAFTNSPLTTAILAALLLDDDGLPGEASGRTRNYVDGGGAPILTNGRVLLAHQITSEIPVGDGALRTRYYTMDLEAFGDLPAVQAQRLDARGFADLLDTLGTFRFFEGGNRGIFDPAGAGGQGSYNQQAYYIVLGTGAFNRAESVVPEPGTWALMILGFAGVGGALRARCRGLAAA